MKLKSIKNPVLKTMLALTACTSLTTFAGTPAVKSKTVVKPEAAPLFTGSVDVGVDSRYYFRGLWFADNIAWSGVNLSIPLTSNLTLGLGALYTSTVDTRVNNLGLNDTLDYSELDLTASLTYDAKFAKFQVVYTSYQFFDGFSGTTFGPAGSARFGAGEYNVLHVNELGFVASSTVAGLNFYGAYYYDFNIGGAYFEVGADYPIKVNDRLSIIPGIKGGYGLDYYSNGAPENGLVGGVTSGFTHLLATVSAPFAITKTATLTPYVAYNFSGRARVANNLTNDEMFGGVKLSVSF